MAKNVAKKTTKKRVKKNVERGQAHIQLSLIHISEPTRLLSISYAVI